jgi:hypothetical protein
MAIATATPKERKVRLNALPNPDIILILKGTHLFKMSSGVVLYKVFAKSNL